MNLGKGVGKGYLKNFYTSLIFSLILAVIILLCIYGIISITMHELELRTSFITLIFAILMIFFSVLIEHRGVEFPFYLVGGAILSTISTFLVICLYLGFIWILKKGFPDLDTLILSLSISMIFSFAIIKLIFSKF